MLLRLLTDAAFMNMVVLAACGVAVVSFACYRLGRR